MLGKKELLVKDSKGRKYVVSQRYYRDNAKDLELVEGEPVAPESGEWQAPVAPKTKMVKGATKNKTAPLDSGAKDAKVPPAPLS